MVTDLEGAEGPEGVHVDGDGEGFVGGGEHDEVLLRRVLLRSERRTLPVTLGSRAAGHKEEQVTAAKEEETKKKERKGKNRIKKDEKKKRKEKGEKP
eukprot:748963-Rhodomonas_salina.2